MRHVIAVRAVIVALVLHVGGAVVQRRPAGVHVVMVVVVGVIRSLSLKAEIVAPALHVFVVTAVIRINNVSVDFGLQFLAAVARVVSVNVPELMRFEHVQLRLLLHVGRAYVLLGVVVASERSPLTHVDDSRQRHQQHQDQDPADGTTHNRTQTAVWCGSFAWEGEVGLLFDRSRDG